MISWRKLFVWVGGGVAALCVAAVILLAIGLYTSPGHRAVAWLVERLTGGTVAVRGLSGNLPDHLHIARFELRDARGTWLRLDDLVLDWNALAIVGNHIQAARVQATHGALLRLPVSRGGAAAPTLDIADLSVRRLDLHTTGLSNRAAVTISGSVHYGSANDAQAKIMITRRDNFGRYRIDGGIAKGMFTGSIDIAEGKDGLLGDMVGLPGLGAVNLQARAAVAGGRNSLTLRATAGPLHAMAAGVFDVAGRTGDLDFSIYAPAMRPRQGVAWQTLAVKGRLRGSFGRPQVKATLDIDRGSVFGLSAQALHLEVNGSGGKLGLVGTTQHLSIPGSRPNLFAASPLRVSARIDLLAKSHPIQFALEHPIMEVQGSAATAGVRAAEMTVRLPSLAAFVGVTHFAMNGSATFHAQVREAQRSTLLVGLQGVIAPRGTDFVARTLGSNATVEMAASIKDGALQSARGTLKGGGLSAQFQGGGGSHLNYDWRIVIPNLSRIVSALTGSLRVDGRLSGPLTDLRATARGSAEVGTRTIAKQHLAMEATATGLPNAKSGDVRVSGQFAGGALAVAATLSRTAKGLNIAIRRGAWRSAQLSGDVLVTKPTSVQGGVTLRMARLADLTAFVGPISGAVDGHFTIASRNGTVLIIPHLVMQQMHYANIAADSIDISGKVTGVSHPIPDLRATLRGISSGSVTGNADLEIDGPLDNLALRIASKLSANGQPITASATATAKTGARQVELQSLNASWQHYAFKLSAPTRIEFADGLAIDALRAKIGNGTLVLAGRVAPKLSLMASATGLTAEMVQPFLPLALEGTVSATAHLSGTLAEPTGDIRIQSRDINMRGAPSSAASSLEAHAVLQGRVIVVDARLFGAKAVQLTVKGRVPLSSTKPVDIAAKGTADLALLTASLAATGQNLQGRLDIDARLAGTWAAPRAIGSVEISNAEFQDFTRGIRLKQIHGRLEAQGTNIRIADFSATSGPGNVTASGTIDLAAPGIPVNITIEAKNARPVSSDLLSATLQTDLKLTGKFSQRLVLAGDVKVLKADINVPDEFPPAVAEIDIRRGKYDAHAPPPSMREIALDLTVSSPGQVFVRGRGLDAEFSGSLRIKGTTAAPQVIGALEMRRGTFSLAGTTLDFQSGKISFEGTRLRERLDPTLDFVAQTSSGGVTATLNISGYASQPKIQLTSSPSLPQDEIMARLLFQQSATQLSALQIAEIADAITSLSGAGSGLNPVAALRKSLGLDRLAVSSASSAAGKGGAAVEAGKYITRNVYVGTTQNVSGGTRAIVQVDITKHLKVQAAAGTDIHASNTSPVTPAQDTGDSVGLTYQLEY